ncbi:Rz-like lysis system protein LysB [Pantoea agglomerans]|uniref:Rz-like lysis system protein LysB n=1 Tax=Enterobacter agglomerans TaxID=549 RepID=UPI0012FA99C1|nr:Rz-like lysis system protein LysB [Pantoea agglomerans]MVT83212.1 LysB family phage lysis regulatory protein [Pantoea agglomerans]
MKNVVVMVLFFLGIVLWQSWNLHNAYQKIHAYEAVIETQGKKLRQKNSQLIALNILTQTSSQAQTQLYAAAERNGQLLRDRQRKIEELKRENENLRLWSDTALPDPVVRLRQRPALAGGESYRQWLSENHPLPAGPGRTAH